MVLITQFLVCRKLRRIGICYDIREEKKENFQAKKKKRCFILLENPQKQSGFVCFKFDIADYSTWFQLQN